MTIFDIQLHEALDGKCFGSKKLASEHNANLANSADEDLRDLIKSALVCDDGFIDDILDVIVENKEQISQLLKFI